MDDLLVRCERHGPQQAVAICPHLLEGAGRGWHMLGSGDDHRPDAVCFACRDAWEPGVSSTEAGIKIAVVCAECYDDLRERHDVAPPGG